jgi:hypothetical protein
MAFVTPVRVIHTKASNGCTVSGFVKQVGPHGNANCFRAEVHVNDCCMAHGHSDDVESAREWADKMREAYLSVHSSR